MATYIKATDLDLKNLCNFQAEQKTAKNNSDVSFYELSFQYNYGARSGPLLIELPELELSRGICQGKKYNNWYLMAPLYESNPEHKKAIDNLQALYEFLVSAVFENKTALKVKAKKVDELHSIRNPLMDNTDDRGMVKPGAPRPVFIDMTNDKAGLWTDAFNRRIDADLCKDSSIKCTPLIRIPCVYLGANPKIRCSFVSAVVHSLAKNGTVNIQQETMKRIQQSDPESVEALQEQIARLTAQLQSRITSSNEGTSGASSSGAGLDDFMAEGSSYQM